MRASIIAAAPFVAAALAQDSTAGGTWHTTVLTIPVNGTTAVTTYTYQYDNPQTAFLTQTNSDGVVTGLPTLSVGTVPTEAAIIPAGLPTGVTSIPLNISGTISYYTVSVGSSTTVALGGAATVEGSSVIPTATDSAGGSESTGSETSGGSDSGSSGTATGNGGSSGTATGSGSSSSETGNAANSVKVGTAGIFGLGALMAAFL